MNIHLKMDQNSSPEERSARRMAMIRPENRDREGKNCVVFPMFLLLALLLLLSLLVFGVLHKQSTH